MKSIKSYRARATIAAACLIAAGMAWLLGCVGSGPGTLNLLGFPVFNLTTANIGDDDAGGGDGDDDAGGDSDDDPCDEPLNRKFVTISMQNRSTSFIHYFFIAIARVRGDTFPGGAVCEEDVELYTQNGYQLIPAGQRQPVGNYCVDGPALVYFHEQGEFRSGSGTDNASLASAIGPAAGTNPTFDNEFSASGKRIPVPQFIIFHNPGTGGGASRLIGRLLDDPCSQNPGVEGTVNTCRADAFYYVRSDGRLDGSASFGQGAGRRNPTEIQGTGCECGAFSNFDNSIQELGTDQLECNQFGRGGQIEYVFLRDDQIPAVPQLLWRVTESSGTIVHDFDESALPNP